MRFMKQPKDDALEWLGRKMRFANFDLIVLDRT